MDEERFIYAVFPAATSLAEGETTRIYRARVRERTASYWNLSGTVPEAMKAKGRRGQSGLWIPRSRPDVSESIADAISFWRRTGSEMLVDAQRIVQLLSSLGKINPEASW